ncbi:MAG TPA: AI-2E family transporter [Actinomycetota bacterium]|nr:AI-2E family transporter [Actinomycetota bacterium]
MWVVDEERDRVFTRRVARVARWGVVAWSVIGVLVLGYLVYRYALYPVRVVVGPLLIATGIVYLLNPLVTALQRRGIPRVWGSLLTYLLFLAVTGVAARYLVPKLVGQMTAFAGAVPELLQRAQDWALRVTGRLGVDVEVGEVFRSLEPGGVAGEFVGRIFSFTVGILHLVLVLVLGMVLGFYLLVDLPKIQRGAMALLPAQRREEVRAVLDRVGQAVGGFFRGQLLVALFVGLASMLGLFIVGLPYWAVVGAVAGLFNLIPMIGPWIAALPALFIAFTTEQTGGILALDPGWPMALGSGLALLVVQQIDNHVISPNVVARTVKLHPVTVMLGLLVGGTLLGLWGMLLAVPLVAAAKILALHYWDTRMQWPPPQERPSPPEGGPAGREPVAAREEERREERVTSAR